MIRRLTIKCFATLVFILVSAATQATGDHREVPVSVRALLATEPHLPQTFNLFCRLVCLNAHLNPPGAEMEAMCQCKRAPDPDISHSECIVDLEPAPVPTNNEPGLLRMIPVDTNDPYEAIHFPPGFVWSQVQEAVKEVDDPSNPILARIGIGILGGLAQPLALTEQYVSRSVLNAPHNVLAAGTKIGEHAAEAYLLSKTGETGEAAAHVLTAIQSFSVGTVAGTIVAGPVKSVARAGIKRLCGQRGLADVAKSGLQATKVTEKGIARIERHLTKTPGIQAGQAEHKMIERLRAGNRTSQDLRFYQHEIIESRMINKTRGLHANPVDAARDAHHRTLIKQGMYRRGYETELYHPDALKLTD